MNKVLIPKEDQRLPDCYGIKIKYVAGRTEQFEVGSHTFLKETGILEFWTHEESKVSWVPLASVERLEFDERFTKIMEIKAEHDRNQLDSKDNS